MSNYDDNISNDVDAGSYDPGDEFSVVQRFADAQAGYDVGGGYDAPEPSYAYDDDIIDDLVDAEVSEQVDSILADYDAENPSFAEYRQMLAERRHEQAQLEYEQQIAAVRPVLDELVAEAGRRYDVPESAGNGRLEQYAAQLLDFGQQQARLAGMSDEEQAALRTPQAVVNALGIAAENLRVRAITDRGLNIIGGRNV